MTVTPAVSVFPPRVRAPIGPSNQAIQAVYLDWANAQVVTVSGTAAQSAVYGGTAQAGSTDTVFELSATCNCWYTVGSANTAAVATAGSQYLAAGVTRYVYIPGGQMLSVIEDTSASNGGYLAMVPALLST